VRAQLTKLDERSFPKERFDVRGLGADNLIMLDGKEDVRASRRTEFTLFECRGEG
jgi:outer membrane protein OmpA-like peptidoglycan-associated protein